MFGRGAGRLADFLGLPEGARVETACTNPAALGSSRSVPLRSIVPAEPFAPGTLIGLGISVLGLQWPAATTTFVEADGAFTGRCSRAGGAHVLLVTPAPGTPTPGRRRRPDWGLHLTDGNIAQGDLVNVVRRQIRTYARMKAFEEFARRQSAMYRGGDADAVRELLAPDVVWHVPGTSAIAGDHRGRDAVMAYFERRRALAGGAMTIVPGERLVAGDTVIQLADGVIERDGEHCTGAPPASTASTATASPRPGSSRSISAAFDAIWTTLT